MKKFLGVVLFIVICTSFLSGCSLKENSVYEYDDVKDVLIRFHVIANSDTEEDQNLKLKLRDKVIEYYYPLLNNSKSIEESRKIILDNKSKVEELARDFIKENGYSYSITSELSHENFPEKQYGNIVLPQGNYEAYRIIIGNGEGHNWWCVMFPPLCFIDVTKGEVEEDESKKELDEVITESKQEPSDEEKTLDDEDVEIDFKFIEVIKDLF